jgi:hypothetical protein
LADDPTNVVSDVDSAVVLMAHNRHVTYGYTGQDSQDVFYYNIKPGSVIVDPWRALPKNIKDVTVIHYGNTRNN